MTEEKRTFKVVAPDGELKEWELDVPKLKKVDNKPDKNQNLSLVFERVKKAGMAVGRHYRLILVSLGSILIVLSGVYFAVWIWQERSHRLEEIHHRDFVTAQLQIEEERKREKTRIQAEEERKRRDEIVRQQLELQRLEEQRRIEEERSRQAELRQQEEERIRRAEEKRRQIELRRLRQAELDAERQRAEARKPHTYKGSESKKYTEGDRDVVYSVINVSDDFVVNGLRVDVGYGWDTFDKTIEIWLSKSNKKVLAYSGPGENFERRDGYYRSEFDGESSKGEWIFMIKGKGVEISYWFLNIRPLLSDNGTVVKP